MERREAGAGGAQGGRGGGEREDDVVPILAAELVNERVVFDADLLAVGVGTHRVRRRPAAVADQVVQPDFGRAGLLLLQEQHGLALGARSAGGDLGPLAVEQFELLVQVVGLLGEVDFLLGDFFVLGEVEQA